MKLSTYIWVSIATSLPLLFLKKKSDKDDEIIQNLDDEPIVNEPADPPEPRTADVRQGDRDVMPAGFHLTPAPEGYSQMKGPDVPADLLPKLRPLLAAEMGTMTKLSYPGRDILAIIQPHYHEPGGPTKPWGWHKGVTLYERKGAMA